MASPPASDQSKMAMTKYLGPEVQIPDLISEIEELQNENDMLQEDLDLCREQLVDLTRKQNDVSEQSIKSSFESIFNGVESFIDDLNTSPGFNARFKAQYQYHLRNRHRVDEFRELGLDTHPDWHRLENKNACSYVVISLIISKHLCAEVFRTESTFQQRRIYPLGVNTKHLEVLNEVQKLMLDSEGQILSHASQWRSQAIWAMTSTSTFDEGLRKSTTIILNNLKHHIRKWAGDSLTLDHIGSLREKVLDRATKSLLLISRSSKEYTFLSTRLPYAINIPACPNFAVKDVATWSEIAPNDVKGAYQCLYPGLARTENSGDRSLPLVRQTVLGFQDPSFQPGALIHTPHGSRSESPKKEDRHPRRSTAGPQVGRQPRRDTPPARASSRTSESRYPSWRIPQIFRFNSVQNEKDKKESSTGPMRRQPGSWPQQNRRRNSYAPGREQAIAQPHGNDHGNDLMVSNQVSLRNISADVQMSQAFGDHPPLSVRTHAVAEWAPPPGSVPYADPYNVPQYNPPGQ